MEAAKKSEETEPVSVADQREAGVAPEDTVTIAEQRAGEDAPEAPVEDETVADDVVLDVPDSPEEQETFAAAVGVAVETQDAPVSQGVDTQRWDSWTVQDGGLPENAELPKVNAVTTAQLPNEDLLRATGVDVEAFKSLIEIQDA